MHNSPFPFPIVSHINTVSAPPSHFLKIHFNIILPTQGLRSGFSPSGFPTNTPCAPRLSPTRATSPAHLILEFITLIIFDEKCQPWSSSLRHLLQSPVTSSVLSPNIFNTQWDYSATDNANGQKKCHGENFGFLASQVQIALINPLNPELNPICYLLALLAHHFLHFSRIRVKSLTLRLLMSYIYIWSTYSWCF